MSEQPDIVERKQAWWSMDTVQRASFVDELIAEIDRLRAELESERAEHEAWKRLAQIPEPITPEDIGMVKATSEWLWQRAADHVNTPLWRFPDE